MFVFTLIFILFLVAIATAIISLTVKDLLAATVIMMIYSFTAALIYGLLGAVDVAFTEAAVGAGISGVFIISALFYLKRRSED